MTKKDPRPVFYLVLCKQRGPAVEITSAIEVGPHSPGDLAAQAFEDGWELAIGMATDVSSRELTEHIQSGKRMMEHPEALILYYRDDE